MSDWGGGRRSVCIEARKWKQSEKKEKAICNEQMALLAEVIAETALTSSSSSRSSELYVHMSYLG